MIPRCEYSSTPGVRNGVRKRLERNFPRFLLIQPPRLVISGEEVISMNRPVHFEIHADDTGRAAEFYKNVFGWDIKKMEDQEYWLITTNSAEVSEDNPGINGGLMKRRGPSPIDGAAVNAFVISINVNDMDQTLSLVKEFGGKVVVDVMPVAGVGWLAYSKDTEGNIFGLMQNDANAK